MHFLDRLYAAGGILAAISLVLIVVLTLAQVIGRIFGVIIPDAGDIAGYAMAAAVFLALAQTLRTGGHIRVNLLLTRMPPRLRHAFECWCLAFLTVVGGLLAAFAVKMVIESFEIGDVSTGMMPIPLWIPQLSMAVGAVLLELAVIEETVQVVRGRAPHYEQAPDADAFVE